MAHQNIDISTKDCVCTEFGTIVSIDSDARTAIVDTDNYGQLTNIPFHFHCEDPRVLYEGDTFQNHPDPRDGFLAFRAGDEVLLVGDKDHNFWIVNPYSISRISETPEIYDMPLPRCFWQEAFGPLDGSGSFMASNTEYTKFNWNHLLFDGTSGAEGSVASGLGGLHHIVGSESAGYSVFVDTTGWDPGDGNLYEVDLVFHWWSNACNHNLNTYCYIGVDDPIPKGVNRLGIKYATGLYPPPEEGETDKSFEIALDIEVFDSSYYDPYVYDGLTYFLTRPKLNCIHRLYGQAFFLDGGRSRHDIILYEDTEAWDGEVIFEFESGWIDDYIVGFNLTLLNVPFVRIDHIRFFK